MFAEKDGTQAAAQFKAFEDTWEWNQAAAALYEELVEGGGRVSDVMQAFRRFLNTNDMLAYLTMMAPRLVELRRVLKPSGSIYLHCDPTASHYLKLLLDAVFGPQHFRGEIIWKRSSAHSDTKHGTKQHGRIHDVLLFYSKGEDWSWVPQYTKYDEQYTSQFYKHTEPKTGRIFRLGDLTGSGPRNGESGGPLTLCGDTVRPAPGRHWALGLKEGESVQDAMDRLWQEGRIWYEPGKMPAYRRYLDEMPGVVLQDIWTDIKPIGAQAAERLGYPTQKPEALLERIIKSHTNEGDTVLDPFCGCGTAIAVAQKLNRQWIGIDITHLAIGLIKSRLRDAFGDAVAQTYKVVGEPTDLSGARELAHDDPYQFQWWALGLVGARPTEQKKGSDQGIDGRLYFHDEENGHTKQIILSVKSGHVSVSQLRDLRGVIDREKAEIGVLLCLEDATRPMQTEAATVGFYRSHWGNHPRLQILTIAELLSGKTIDYPLTVNVTHRRAPKAAAPMPEQYTLAPAAAAVYDDNESVLAKPKKSKKPNRKRRNR